MVEITDEMFFNGLKAWGLDFDEETRQLPQNRRTIPDKATVSANLRRQQEFEDQALLSVGIKPLKRRCR